MSARLWWIVMPPTALLACVTTTLAFKLVNPWYLVVAAFGISDVWWLAKRAPWRTGSKP